MLSEFVHYVRSFFPCCMNEKEFIQHLTYKIQANTNRWENYFELFHYLTKNPRMLNNKQFRHNIRRLLTIALDIMPDILPSADYTVLADLIAYMTYLEAEDV